jgi:GGDEF domain-containing protein
MAIYPTHGDDIDTLMKKADIAMYRAKARGYNRFCCYSNPA